VLEQLEPAHLGALLAHAKIQHVLGRVMLVHGGEDLLVGAQLDAAIDHRQALGRAAGKGDLRGCGLQITTGPFAHLAFALPGFFQAPVHRQAGIAVDLQAVALDGVAHRFGV